MKRKDIITKLIKEGFSGKTLAGLNDKQLNTLSRRILGEQYNTDDVNPVQIPKTDTTAITRAKQNKKQFITYEGDVTEDKKSNDKEESIVIKRIKYKIEHSKDEKKIKSLKGLLKRMEDNSAKSSEKEIDEQFFDDRDTEAMRGWMPYDPRYDDFNKTVTVPEPFVINFNNSGEYAKLTLLLQKYKIPFEETEGGGSDSIGSEMREEEKPKFKSKTEWLKSKGIIKDNNKKEETKESVGLNEWVNKLVGKNVHPFTSKNEIMELLHKNLREQEVMKPEVKKKINLPSFLTYDAINNIEMGTPAPAQPTIKPKTRPGKPDIRPKKDNPYQPGPGINPAPKAEKNR